MENQQPQLPAVIKVSTALLQEILAYLSTRPFSEVADKIGKIQADVQQNNPVQQPVVPEPQQA